LAEEYIAKGNIAMNASCPVHGSGVKLADDDLPGRVEAPFSLTRRDLVTS
jgi:hypothetical protein